MIRFLTSVVAVSISFSAFSQVEVNESDYLSKKMSLGVEFFSSSNEFTGELAGFSEDVDVDSDGFAIQFGVKTGSSNTLTTFLSIEMKVLRKEFMIQKIMHFTILV